MDSDLLSLVQKHSSKGILLDTNILLLYLIGKYDRSRIEKFKRTNTFTPKDYDFLFRLTSQFQKIISTPHILTEVSNLSGSLSKPAKMDFFNLFAEEIQALDEQVVSGEVIASQNSFITHGMTDSAIEYIAKREFLVMTADLPLYKLPTSVGIDTVNFNHVRLLG